MKAGVLGLTELGLPPLAVRSGFGRVMPSRGRGDGLDHKDSSVGGVGGISHDGHAGCAAGPRHHYGPRRVVQVVGFAHRHLNHGSTIHETIAEVYLIVEVVLGARRAGENVFVKKNARKRP